MKAFGDAVVAGEAPHGCDFFFPGKQSIAERNQGREPATATAEFGDITQEAGGQVAAFFLVVMFL